MTGLWNSIIFARNLIRHWELCCCMGEFSVPSFPSEGIGGCCLCRDSPSIFVLWFYDASAWGVGSTTMRHGLIHIDPFTYMVWDLPQIYICFSNNICCNQYLVINDQFSSQLSDNWIQIHWIGSRVPNACKMNYSRLFSFK